MPDQEHHARVVAARVAAIEDALRRRTERLRQDPDYVPGQPRKPRRRLPSFRRGEPLYPAEPLPTEEVYRPPTSGNDARPTEVAWRRDCASLLDTIVDQDLPAAGLQEIGLLLNECWDHLTRTDANGYSLCFPSPLRDGLLKRLDAWLTTYFPALRDQYAALWASREPPPAIHTPTPTPAPAPPTQQEML